MRLILDTTVLVYGLSDQAEDIHRQCHAILEAVGDDRAEAYTTPAVIAEFLHVRARIKDRATAAANAAACLDLITLLPVGVQETELTIALFGGTQAKSFDAMLASCAISFGPDALVSADNDFKGIKGLTWWTPERCVRELSRN